MVRTLADAAAILRKTFGYDQFRAGQADVVASILAGRDTLGVLPTGGGKSLCFQVPALAREGLTVVVSPLISLMKDQVDRLRVRGVEAAFLNSSLSETESARCYEAMDRRRLKLLYVAPERLLAASLIDRVARAGVSLLAVDEAHCISEWGHDFRPSFRRIGDVNRSLGRLQIAALTATATPAVRRDIVEQLGMRRPNVIVSGFDRANLHYSAIECRTDAQKDARLVELLGMHARPAIVYASTRFGVERVARRLARAGIRAAAYHGGLADPTRRTVQEAFMSGATDIIVATNAFGMGIDKANVRLVVHYSMPGTLEAYYQEAGRAGRDGKASRCILLHTSHDRITHEWFIHGMHPERSLVEREFSAIIASHRAGVVTRRPSGRAQMAAHRLLLREGVLTSAPRTAMTSIRLLATPARIKRELPLVERALLRELWRASAGAFEQGVDVDLSAIRMSGTWRSRAHLLESLRQRQFIDFMSHSADLLLARPNAPLDSFHIDWEGLERRMMRDIEKLDAMQTYARTAHCRREFVLRYFGDEAARSPCGACDNCLAH